MIDGPVEEAPLQRQIKARVRVIKALAVVAPQVGLRLGPRAEALRRPLKLQREIGRAHV